MTTEEILTTLQFLVDDVTNLEAEIAWHKAALVEDEFALTERRQRLAEAYAKPCNDRRVSDAVNVTGYEFCCRIIEPTCEMFAGVGYERNWCVRWFDANNEVKFGLSAYTPQTAWAAAFAVLDRRTGGAK
jgi:hypothetical protein